jgi:uncharacterized protein YbjT (DUF2867 family)
MRILVTGANGFVGRALIQKLLNSNHEVLALIRSNKNNLPEHPKLTVMQGDLLKASSLPELQKIDKAYFLVHGLNSESSRFEYEETLAAVNFINWIRSTGASIIYLGGLGPKDIELSPHLRSRHLTGAVFGASGIPTIEFRASIIMGEGSTSFEMLKAISERFPVRPEMKLLNKPCQPLGLEDLLSYLIVSMDLKFKGHLLFEIGGPDVVTYGELLDLYAELTKLKRKKVKVPEVDNKVILKILDYSIPEHSLVGKKLVESLEYPTVVTSTEALEKFPEIRPLKLVEAMKVAIQASKTTYPPIWEKDFLKVILSDKILTQSGLLSPEILKAMEKVTKLKNIISKKDK